MKQQKNIKDLIISDFDHYKREFSFNKQLILILLAVILLSWSVHFVLSKETVTKFGIEDGPFQWLTFVFFLAASVLFFIQFIKSRNLFFLLLSIIFFIGAGEEISWGYRIFNYGLPDSMKRYNVSKELNIHNLQIFNTIDLNGGKKHGLERLFEIEFLFKVWTFAYCILLPVLSFHSDLAARIIKKIKLPLPPLSLGIFFAVNYLLFKMLVFWFNPPDFSPEDLYVTSFVELFEFNESVIVMIIAVFFFSNRNIMIEGEDMKRTIPPAT